jgi:hypothetical protein
MFSGLVSHKKGVVCLAEFCTCGSLMISGHCTNKNCSNRSESKKASAKPASRKKNISTSTEPKKVRTRKSSKCVTYNLNDVQEEENVN